MNRGIQFSSALKSRVEAEEHYYVSLLKKNNYINDKTPGRTDGDKIENSIWKLFDKTSSNTQLWNEENIDELLADMTNNLLFRLSRSGMTSGQANMYEQLRNAVAGIQKSTDKKIQEIMKDNKMSQSDKIKNKVNIQIGSGREMMAIDKLLENWFKANGLSDGQGPVNKNFSSFQNYNDGQHGDKAMVLDIGITLKESVLDYENTGTWRNNIELDIKSSVDHFHVVDANIQQTLASEQDNIKKIFEEMIIEHSSKGSAPDSVQNLKYKLATAAIEWKLQQDIPVFVGIGERGGIKALSCSKFINRIEKDNDILDIQYTRDPISGGARQVPRKEAVNLYYKTLNKVSVFYGKQ